MTAKHSQQRHLLDLDGFDLADQFAVKAIDFAIAQGMLGVALLLDLERRLRHQVPIANVNEPFLRPRRAEGANDFDERHPSNYQHAGRWDVCADGFVRGVGVAACAVGARCDWRKGCMENPES